MRWQVLLILIGVEIVYLIVGGLIFWSLEKTPLRSSSSGGSSSTDTPTTINITLLLERINSYFENGATCISELELAQLVNQTIAIQLNSSAADDGEISTEVDLWTLPGSIFFAMTVVTTIGYGNIVPTTSGSKAFCCCYALIGIPLTLVMLMGVGEKLNYASALVEKRLTKKRPRSTKVVRTSVIFAVGMVFFLFIPAAIFSAIQDWSYGTGLYYGVITLTTIGFGDYVAAVPSPAWLSSSTAGFYRITVGLWIYTGLAWLSGFISSLQETLNTAVERVDTDPVIDRYRAKRAQRSEQQEVALTDTRTDGNYEKLELGNAELSAFTHSPDAAVVATSATLATSSEDDDDDDDRSPTDSGHVVGLNGSRASVSGCRVDVNTDGNGILTSRTVDAGESLPVLSVNQEDDMTRV